MSSYIGRFAPSPSGPLHLGSLYTAVASFLDARAHQGQWLLRIEDIDTPRTQAGASAAIIKTLQDHGLFFDNDIRYQHQHYADYDKMLTYLEQRQLSYHCTCSRQQLHEMGDFYPNTCRDNPPQPELPYAIRLKTPDYLPSFEDRLLGKQQAPHLPYSHPPISHDFVIFRKDGFYAYQLAVVADDIDQGITHIVRGSDILDSTFKQLCLYDYMNKPIPQFLHLPVLLQKNGQKLSKQNLATAVESKHAEQNLLIVLQLLQQPLPPNHLQKHCNDILSFAIKHWNIAALPKSLHISALSQ